MSETMKTAVVFVVLLATVFCHPVKRSASSSESSEEVVKPTRLQLKALPQTTPVQSVTTGSDESSDSSDEAQASDTASDDSDDSDDTDENDTDESSESAEFEETTPAPITTIETTLPPIIDNGRGDNLGYPSDYKKSIIFVESNKIEKGPSPYKFYGLDKAEESLASKKTSIYDSKDGNDIEKNLKVYKALQVHDDILEEDASTPEVESQGLDVASGTVEEPAHRQAPMAATPEESEGAESAEDESASASAGDSASASEESESSQSSEETTATPGAADSDSSQSSESQESDSSETEETSEAPVVITAK